MQEYHELTDKKLQHTLTGAESARLREIRDEIAEIDSRRPKPDTWNIQERKLREEFEQLRATGEALPNVFRKVVAHAGLDAGPVKS